MGGVEEIYTLLAQAGTRISDEPSETKINQLLSPFEILEKPLPEKTCFALLGIPFDTTSVLRRGSKFAPAQVRQLFLANKNYNPSLGVEIPKDTLILNLGDIKVMDTDPGETERRIRKVTSFLSAKGIIPLIVGGDHWTTFGTVAGMTDSVKKMGLIVFDAHTDVRESHYGQVTSGTPVFRILEEIPGTPVKPENIVEVGINGWHNSRHFFTDYIDKKGITVFTSHHVRKQCMESIMKQAMEIVNEDTEGFFVSIDIDALDAACAPATGSSNPGGLNSAEILEAVFLLGKTGKAVGIDVVEIFPDCDVNNITSILGASILQNFMAGCIEARKK